MSIFNNQENRIRCGKCNTEFDLMKNKDGCPMCGFGKDFSKPIISTTLNSITASEYMNVPPLTNLKSGKPIINAESNVWGAWLMFNDFFAPKFICRVLVGKMHHEKKDYIILEDLMADSISMIKSQGLSKYKGFPNLQKDSKGMRLVNHFLITFVKMGLVEAKSVKGNPKDLWTEKWGNIAVSITKEGYEFAKLGNNIFDYHKDEQTLTKQEKEWLKNYLVKIDAQGYKEYSALKEVYDFLKKGNNGNSDLWKWFENNKKIREYILQRSERAKADPEIFKQQLSNYAKTFSSAKISLLREFGVVRDKRNDYTIIGEL